MPVSHMMGMDFAVALKMKMVIGILLHIRKG